MSGLPTVIDHYVKKIVTEKINFTYKQNFGCVRNRIKNIVANKKKTLLQYIMSNNYICLSDYCEWLDKNLIKTFKHNCFKLINDSWCCSMVMRLQNQWAAQAKAIAKSFAKTFYVF